MFTRISLLGWFLAAAAPSFAAQTWSSTFDSNADGVVDVRTDDPNKVMIGANTGGRQTITTSGRTVTNSDKAGRSVGGTPLTANDSFGAYYKWNYTNIQASADSQEIAGFVSNSATHSTREFMGAAFDHFVDGSGHYRIQFGARWASEGFTGSGRLFAPGSLDFGTSPPIGQEFQIALGYDGSNHFPGTTTGGKLTVTLYNASGSVLKSVSDYIRSFGNLGVTQTDPALDNEVNNLSLPFLGWEDFISGDSSDHTHTWSVDTLNLYNDATGAFAAVVPEPSSLLLLLAAGGLLGRRGARRRP